MPKLPIGAREYKRTPTFTADTVPAGLLRAHTTREGTWARIVVARGELEYRIPGPPAWETRLRPGTPGIVEPEVPHEVAPIGDVAFHVEFLRVE